MHADAPALIWDACDALQCVLRFTAGRTFDEYVDDQMLHSAVERQFGIAGEALSQLRKLDPATAQQIPALANVVGFRNLLIHGYAAIEHGRVWSAINTNAPALIAVLGELLSRLPSPDEPER